MTRSKETPQGAGMVFPRLAVVALITGAASIFAVGGLTKKDAMASNAGTGQVASAQTYTSASDLTLSKTQVRSITLGSLPGAGQAEIGRGVLAKALDVTLSNTTGKQWDLLGNIGYEIHGEAPRLFLASRLKDLQYQQPVDLRKNTFIKSTLPLILHVNALILHDRARVKSLRDEEAEGRVISQRDVLWLDEIAERYGVKNADAGLLLKHVDVIPPSLAISQAAEESGWGTSRFAREGNALFGQRAYASHKKGIVPKKRAHGKSFRVRAFDHLIDGVKSYAHNLNSHPAYKDFREVRAEMRANLGDVDGYRLAGGLTRYSERGADYVKTIRIIMRANKLQVFDDAKLGSPVAPDA